MDAVSSGAIEMGHGGPYYWKGKVAAAQYLSAVVGSIVANSDSSKSEKEEILQQLLEFIKYVYDQQASAAINQSEKQEEAFGKWTPPK